jgi:hypothetical protein
MAECNGNGDARLLENLAALDGSAAPPPLDPELESRLLDRLSRRRRLLPFPWDLVLLALLLAVLAWDVVRIVRLLIE